MANRVVLAGILQVVIKLSFLPRGVEVNVPPVIQSELAAAGEDDRQVRVAVTVTKRHTAAEQGHRGIQQRAFSIFRFSEPIEEIAELLDVECVARRQIVQ